MSSHRRNRNSWSSFKMATSPATKAKPFFCGGTHDGSTSAIGSVTPSFMFRIMHDCLRRSSLLPARPPRRHIIPTETIVLGLGIALFFGRAEQQTLLQFHDFLLCFFWELEAARGGEAGLFKFFPQPVRDLHFCDGRRLHQLDGLADRK